MKQLMMSRLFEHLSVPSKKVSNFEMQHAYETFLEHVLTLNQSNPDYQTIYQRLNFTRVEFQSLQSQITYEQGKKCLKKAVFTKSYFCYKLRVDSVRNKVCPS